MPRIDNPLEKRLADFACCATFIFRLFDNHF